MYASKSFIKKKNMPRSKYKIRLFDGLRFMASSLSRLADNLAGLHKDKRIDCNSNIEYITAKDCNKSSDKKFYEEIQEIHIRSITEILTNFVSCREKVFIDVNTWDD